MKYRLMGIEKTLDNTGMKTRFIGVQNGVIVKHKLYSNVEAFTLQGLTLLIASTVKVKEVDVYIPEYIINTLKEEE